MLLTTQQCYTCGKETKHFNGKCSICESKKAVEDRNNYFSHLDSLTLEQRVRRIEEMLYEYHSYKMRDL